MNYRHHIGLGVEYLMCTQRQDGRFGAWCSGITHDFSGADPHDCTFVSSVIGTALAEVEGAGTIRGRIAEFLLTQQANQGSWNYWVRGSSDSVRRPLPDDIDDTAYAIMALYHGLPGGSPAEMWAQMAQLLIATETAPGGPYRTWLTGRPEWSDSDVVVNANVGRVLALQGVETPGLESHIEKALTGGGMGSPYYRGEAFGLYSLSHWYRGTALGQLRRRVSDGLAGASVEQPLTCALLVSAACNLGMREQTEALRHRLAAAQSPNGSWSAEGLLPLRYGGMQYVGSEALTTALCLEALHPASRGHFRSAATTDRVKQVVQRCATEQLEGMDEVFRSELMTYIEQLLAGPAGDTATGLPATTAAVFAIELPRPALESLVCASAFGWLAYTLYDNIWDIEPEAASGLGFANVSMRISRDAFRNALPQHQNYQREVDRAFMEMDQANAWEYRCAQVPVAQRWQIDNLPCYGDLMQLAERSWGHAMTALGVVTLHPDPRVASPLRVFFRHFLIARQLNDDAHDWEEDMHKGRVTAVVELVLRGYAKTGAIIPLEPDSDLRVFFWESAIDGITSLILEHCRLAAESVNDLSRLGVARSEKLLAMLQPLQDAAQAARRERDRSRAFITAYQRHQ